MTLAFKIENGDSQNKFKIIFAFIVISVKEKMAWISSSTAVCTYNWETIWFYNVFEKSRVIREPEMYLKW